MSQIYTDPSRESDPNALPNAETFKGYDHQCPECSTYVPLFPGYYGVLSPVRAQCPECEHIGVTCTSIDTRWFWWPCSPNAILNVLGVSGCLPDSDPIGPFDTETLAIADAQQE